MQDAGSEAEALWVVGCVEDAGLYLGRGEIVWFGMSARRVIVHTFIRSRTRERGTAIVGARMSYVASAEEVAEVLRFAGLGGECASVY